MRTSYSNGLVRPLGFSAPLHRSQQRHAQVVAAGWQRGQQALLQQGLPAVLGPVSPLNAQQHQVRGLVGSRGQDQVLAALHIAARTALYAVSSPGTWRLWWCLRSCLASLLHADQVSNKSNATGPGCLGRSSVDRGYCGIPIAASSRSA